MTSLLLLLLSFTLVFSDLILNHKCHHHIIYQKLKNDIVELPIDDTERNMQSAAPRNMVISFDMSYFNTLNLNDPLQKSFRDNSEKALKIAIKFFYDLIKIVPKPAGGMRWDLSSPKCGLVTVSAGDKTTDKPSDLHLYVSYTNETNQQYVAYAGWCRFLKGLGPSHGLVNFNFGHLKNYAFTNPIVFYDLIEIVIHEITHILGFSGNDIKNWVNPSKKPHTNPTIKQNIRGFSVTLLATPNVLAHARQYYNCTTLLGMPLENQGDYGSQGSHWETNAINNEFMNAAITVTQNFLTKFTTSLLRDTGFYSSINANLEEQSFFGKDKGCSFITGNCSTEHREICSAGATNQCDFYSYGISKCTQSAFVEDTCPFMKVYGNSKCYDETGNFLNSDLFIKKIGVAFGNQSRCFLSSLSDPNIIIQPQGICYNFSCNPSQQVIVTVGAKTLTCTQNKQVLSLTGWQGTLTCPDNLADFCSYKGFCPNHCSTNGYCINNVCTCIAGFSGADCSTKV